MLATIENVIIVHNRRRRRAKRDLATLNTFFSSLRWLFRQCHATSSSSGRCRSITECHTLFYNSNPTSIHLHRLSTFSLNVMKSPTRAHPFVELFLRWNVSSSRESVAQHRALRSLTIQAERISKWKLWEIACRLAALRTAEEKTNILCGSIRESFEIVIDRFVYRSDSDKRRRFRYEFPNVKFCRHFFISHLRCAAIADSKEVVQLN